MLTGPVEDNIANSVIAQLPSDAQDSTKDIYLCVNTPGGICFSWFGNQVDTMNFIKADVQTIVMEWLHPWGPVIAIMAQKANVSCFKCGVIH